MNEPQSSTTEAIITRELQAGEELLWTGRPGTGLIFQPSDALLTPFALVWSVVICGFIADSIRMRDPVGVVWDVLLVAFGLYFSIGRIFHNAYRSGGTGTIYFGLMPSNSMLSRGLPKPPGFIRIDDALGVFALVAEARAR